MLGRGTGHVTIDSRTIRRFAHAPEFSGLGRLVRFTPDRAWRFTADIAAYEAAHNRTAASTSSVARRGIRGPARIWTATRTV